jgi:hypothetical protein
VLAGTPEPNAEECLAALIITNGEEAALKMGKKKDTRKIYLDILDNIQQRV